MMSAIETGKYVLIGDELGGVEEYLNTDDSIFASNGRLYAAITGILQVDKANRLIKVHYPNEEMRKKPKKGDIVIGIVRSIRKNSVGVDIFKVNNNLAVNMGLVGNVHVASVSKKYINNLTDAFQRSDIIRAQVVGELGGEYMLATNFGNTGVIYSECKFCGNKFTRKNRDQLVCPFCENVERKVLAPDFGMIKEHIKHF